MMNKKLTNQNDDLTFQYDSDNDAALKSSDPQLFSKKDKEAEVAEFISRLEICAKRVGSVNAFAKKAGVSQGSVRNYMLGSDPSRTILIALAKAAEVSVGWLATGEGDMETGQATPVAQEREASHEARPLNMELLIEIMEGVDKGLEIQELVLDIDKKAELVGLLYEHFIDNGRMDQATMKRFLRLVK